MHNNNLQTLSENKNPSLKCRYAKGLGDLVACILHGPLSWLTFAITKKRIPCSKCSLRAEALNTLVPIPFWKLFYDSIDELLKDLSQEMVSAGYKVSLTEDGKGISSSKFSETLPPLQSSHMPNIPSSDIEDYNLISSGDNIMGDFIVRVQIFKRK
jgi:hypothetical protein